MSERLAFVLNLDAEHELEDGARWTAPSTLSARLTAIASEMRLPEGAIWLRPGMKVPEGYVARLWCPTPRALAVAASSGAPVGASPPIDVVRTVNERGFAFDLAAGELEPVLRSQSLEEIEAWLSTPSPTGRWRIKRGLGASGRGQRVVAHGALEPATRGWLVRATRRHPVVIEPDLPIERELAVYGWARASGVILTGLRGQTTDARGAFVRCGRIAHDDLDGDARPFLTTAERVGAALVAAGYEGPFGTDGYLYRTPSGALRARTLSEINARYCMGWDERDGF